MRHLIATVFAVVLGLFCESADAQSFIGPASVVQPTTPGHCVKVGTQGGAILADAGAGCGSVTPGGDLSLGVVTPAGGTQASTLAVITGRILSVTDFAGALCSSVPCPTGTGGDDTVALQNAINAVEASGGRLVFPIPSSGSYNVCSAQLTISGGVRQMTFSGLTAGTIPLRILPGCASGIQHLLYVNPDSAASGIAQKAVIAIDHLRIDGWCLVPYPLYVNFANAMVVTNSLIRNATAHGADVYVNSGVNFEMDSSNDLENTNDPGHTCYNVHADLPDYNFYTKATDGRIAAHSNDAVIANYYSNGGNNDFSGAHGWGWGPTNTAGQPDGRPTHTFWINDRATVIGAVADDYNGSGIYLTADADRGSRIIGNMTGLGTDVSGPGIEVDNVTGGAAVQHTVISGNSISGGGPAGIQIDGTLDPTTLICNNAYDIGCSAIKVGGAIFGDQTFSIFPNTTTTTVAVSPPSGNGTDPVELDFNLTTNSASDIYEFQLNGANKLGIGPNGISSFPTVTTGDLNVQGSTAPTTGINRDGNSLAFWAGGLEWATLSNTGVFAMAAVNLNFLNGVTVTPCASCVLTIAAAKTLTVSNTLTLSGTDGSTLNIGAGGTLGSNAFTSTAYAPLASPTFTGTPLSTTAAVDTNTTQIATTAYVIGEGYLKSATASSTYAPIASPTFTGNSTFPQISLAGNISAASWTTNGLGLNGTPVTYTDTTSTGTVTIEAAFALPTATIAASSATTITNEVGLYIPAVLAGTNVTATNRYALYTAGLDRFAAGFTANGGQIGLNTSSNFVVNIGTGSTTSTVTIGGGSNAVTIAASAGNLTLSNLSTGTSADTLCLSAGGVVLIQAAACTISSARFKEDIQPWNTDALGEVLKLRSETFVLKGGAKNPDKNAARNQIGLMAENVAKVEPKCAIFEPDMKTPKSYRQECIIAMLTKSIQQLSAANDKLTSRIAKLERVKR